MRTLLLAGLALGAFTTVAAAGPLAPARLVGGPASAEAPASPTVLVGVRAIGIGAGGRDQSRNPTRRRRLAG